MKTLKTLVSLAFLFLLVQQSYAQYGNGGMNSGYGGMGNRGMQNNNYHPQPKSEETEKNRLKRIDLIVAKFKTDLALDDLQVYAIRKEIDESDKSMLAILNKKDMEDADKIKEIEAISKKNDNTILTYLNKEQKEKYTKYIEERKATMESNRSRR